MQHAAVVLEHKRPETRDVPNEKESPPGWPIARPDWLKTRWLAWGARWSANNQTTFPRRFFVHWPMTRRLARGARGLTNGQITSRRRLWYLPRNSNNNGQQHTVFVGGMTTHTKAAKKQAIRNSTRIRIARSQGPPEANGEYCCLLCK